MNDPVLNVSSSSTKPGEDVHRSFGVRAWLLLHSLIRPPPSAEVLREVVEDLIEEPLSESGLSSAERMLLGNIIQLRERTIADCMVPRADIIAADADSSLKVVTDLMAMHAHSRIPIYRGTLDDAIGMVHMKDILPCLAYQQVRAISDLLRPVMFVAPSMPAARLLLQMRQNRQHMALVVDEFGGVDGLVTIEDLVEQIVGKIEDEHDAPAVPPIITRADGTLLVDARLLIEEFETRTGMTLPLLDGEGSDTLGGYVANLAGRVPHIGESFKSGILSFEVLEMDQTRIKRLRIKTPRKTDSETETEKRSQTG